MSTPALAPPPSSQSKGTLLDQRRVNELTVEMVHTCRTLLREVEGFHTTPESTKARERVEAALNKALGPGGGKV